jgi:hypothetical protein
VSDQPGPPSLSLALHSVVDAAVDATARTGLLRLVHPDVVGRAGGDSIVVPFPSPRRPSDDGPDAA